MADPYIQPDHLTQEALAAISTRLEERAAHPKFKALYQPYFDNILKSLSTKLSQNTSCILEIGCGTGPIIRQLENQIRAAKNTQVELHACDISQHFLNQAELLAGNSSSRSCSRIEWQLSQANQPLPYPDDKFDFIIMHTLLGHIEQPEIMLAEAKRLLKPTGEIIIFDTDFLSATFAYNDIEKGRLIDYQLMTTMAHNPDICRILPELIQRAEPYLVLQNSTAHNLTEIGQGDFWLSSVHSLAILISTLGIDEQNAQAWVNYQLTAHDKQQFFASCNYYTFYLTKGISLNSK